MSDFDHQMSGIHSRWGQLIETVCKTSSVPREFLAALVANESNGHTDARRFEPGVYHDLVAIQQGWKARYGSITQAVLKGMDDVQLRNLATSFGLTQIMGYHVAGISEGLNILLDPVRHLGFAVRMLASFAQRFGLDLAKDFEDLFRCWNTGRPTGRTFDKDYVPNGLARMEAYRKILTLPLFS